MYHGLFFSHYSYFIFDLFSPNSLKNSLAGQLLVQSGVIPKHVVEKYERMATDIGKPMAKLAFIMDRLREERERGISIVTESWGFETTRLEFDLVDVPGHWVFFFYFLFFFYFFFFNNNLNIYYLI